jgi:hypothetical protein
MYWACIYAHSFQTYRNVISVHDGCRNFQKKIERDVYFKTIFVIALSVFCLYLLKMCAMVAYS